MVRLILFAVLLNFFVPREKVFQQFRMYLEIYIGQFFKQIS